MASIDAVTNQARGYLKMGAFPRLDSVLFTLERRDPCAPPLRMTIPNPVSYAQTLRALDYRIRCRRLVIYIEGLD